jgi:hypothetical protein
MLGKQKYIIVILIGVFLVGCSQGADSVTTPQAEPIRESKSIDNDWTWNQWMFSVDESHSVVEAVPMRTADKNLNVTRFVEKTPCTNCLQLGKLLPQGDGTYKLNVSLRHPYPNNPEFTGFDVRGVVIFPATRHWYAEDLDLLNSDLMPWEEDELVPLYFSWPEDGGGALLNVEGYSYYFWPGFDLGDGYQAAIFKYQQGKYASSEYPDSTINPYLQFNDGSARRIFKTSDYIKREYHLRLPPGEFSFGYIVQASWVQPLVYPVTNPAEDFPPSANAEDVFIISFDQTKPMDPFMPVPTEDKVFASTTFTFKVPEQEYAGHEPWLYTPEIRYWADSPKIWEPVALSDNDFVEVEPGVHRKEMYCDLWDGWEHDPFIDGTYPAVLAITSTWFPGYPDPQPYDSLLSSPPTFHLVEVELVSTGPE